MPKTTRKRKSRSRSARARPRRAGRYAPARRVVRRSRAVGGGGGGPDSGDYVRLNTGGTRTFTVDRTVNIVNLTALGNVAALYNPSSTLSPLFSTYTAQFNKMKVNWIKLAFTMTTLETADDDIMPIVYIRYNNDPDLTTTGFTQARFSALPGTVKKTFTSTSNRLTYTIKPQIMTAGLQVGGSGYMPMPRKMGYIDGTQDITLFGAQYYLSPTNAGVVIQLSEHWNVTWKDPK